MYSNNNNNCHSGFQGNRTSTLHYHGQRTSFTQSPNTNNTEIVELLNTAEKQTSPVLMQQVILQNEPSNSSTYHPVLLPTVARPANSNTQKTIYIVNRTQRHVSPVRAGVWRNPALNVQKSDITNTTNTTNAMLSISVTRPSSSLLASQPCVSSVVTPFAVPRSKNQKQKPCNPPATSQSLDIFSYLNSPMPSKHQHVEDSDTAMPDPLEFCLYDGERLRQEKEHRKTRISENSSSEEMNTSQNGSSSETILCNPATDETNVKSIASLSCATSSSAGTPPCDSPKDEIANIPENTTPITVQQRLSPGIEGSDNIIHSQSSTSPSAKEKIIINNDPVISVGICDVPPVREESSDLIHNHLSAESGVEEDDECMPMIIACYSLNPDANDDKTSKDSPNENQTEIFFENNTRKISDDKTTSGRSPHAKITFSSQYTKKRTKKNSTKFLDHIPKSKILRKTNPQTEKDTMDDTEQNIVKAKASIEAQNKQAATLSTSALNTPVEDVPRRRRTAHSSSPKKYLSPMKKNNLMSSEKMNESYTGCVPSTDVIQDKDLSSTQDNTTSSGIVEIGAMSQLSETSSVLSSWINTAQRKLPSKKERSCNNVASVQTQDAPSTRESLKPSKSPWNQADDISPFITNSRSMLKSSHSTSSKPPVCLVNPSRSSYSSRHDPTDNLVARDVEIIEEMNEDKNKTCVEVADSVKILSNMTDVPKKDVDDLQPLDLTVRKRIPSAIDEREAGSSTTTRIPSPTLMEATSAEASSSLREIQSGVVKDSSISDPRETLSALSMNPSFSSAGSAGLSTMAEIIITVDKAKSAATAVKSSASKSSTSLSQCLTQNPKVSVASTLDNPYRTVEARKVSSQAITSPSIDFTQNYSSSSSTVVSNHSSLDLSTSTNNRKDAKQLPTVELKKVSRETLVSFSHMTPGYSATKLATDISQQTYRRHKLPLTCKPTDPRRKKVQPEEKMKWNRPMPISFLPEKKRTDVMGFSDSYDAGSTGYSLQNLEQRIWNRGIFSRFPLSLAPKVIPMERFPFEEETPLLDPRLVLNKEAPPTPDAASAPTSNTEGKIQASKSPVPKMHPPKSVIGGNCPKMINILCVKDFRKKVADFHHWKKKPSSHSLNSLRTSTVKKRPRKNLDQLVEDIHKLKTGYRIGEIKSGSNVLGGKLMGIVMTDNSSRISEFVDKEKSSEVGEKPAAIVVQVMNQPGHQDAGSEAKTIQGKMKDQKVPTYSGGSDPVVMEANASTSGDPGKKSDAAASLHPGRREAFTAYTKTLPGDAIKSFDYEIKEEVREEVEEVKEVAVDSRISTKDSQDESNSLELAKKYLPVIEDSQSSFEAQEACCDEYDHMCMQGIEDSQLGSQPSSRESENEDSVEMIFPFQEEELRKQNEDSPANHKDPSEELISQMVGDSEEITSEKDSDFVSVTETQEKIAGVEKEDTVTSDHSEIENFFTKYHVTPTEEDEPQETSKSNVAFQVTKDRETEEDAKEMAWSNETQNGNDTAKEEINRFPNIGIKIKKEYCEDASLTPQKSRNHPYKNSVLESYFIKKDRSEDKKTGYSPTGSVECSKTSRKRRKLVKKTGKKERRELKKKQKSSYIILSDSSESSEDLGTRVNSLTKLKEAFERTGGRNEDVCKRKLQLKNSNNSNNSLQEDIGNLHDLEELERIIFPPNDEEVTQEACDLKKESQSPEEMEIENDIDIQETGNRIKELSESGELKETVSDALPVHKIQEAIPLNKSTSDQYLLKKKSEKIDAHPEHWKKKMNRRSKDEECSSTRRRNARMMGRWSKSEIPKIQPQNFPSIANIQVIFTR